MLQGTTKMGRSFWRNCGARHGTAPQWWTNTFWKALFLSHYLHNRKACTLFLPSEKNVRKGFSLLETFRVTGCSYSRCPIRARSVLEYAQGKINFPTSEINQVMITQCICMKRIRGITHSIAQLKMTMQQLYKMLFYSSNVTILSIQILDFVKEI